MESSTHDGGDNGDDVVVVRNHQTKMQLPTLESLEFDKIKKDQTVIFLELRQQQKSIETETCRDIRACRLNEPRVKEL
jgi:hypothetical protein